MYGPDDEVGSRFVEGLDVRFTLYQRRNDIRLVIPGSERRRGAFRAFRKIAPAALVMQLAIQTLPPLGLFLGIQQGKFRPCNHWNIRASRDFEQAQCPSRFLLDPLVAADGCNAENVELIRL